ncbi:DNA-binding protein [Roseateles noduli]|nr:DNA-binding protein [Roseateles noduli]
MTPSIKLLADSPRRALRGSLAPLPLYRVDLDGQAHRIADMHLLHPEGAVVEFLAPFDWPLDADMREGRFDGLPYPLQDMRPQGFLGRYFAHYYAPLLQIGEDPNAWSDDDALHAISLLGSDAPGNLLVGERAHAQWQEHLRRVADGRILPGIADADLPSAYPSLARLILSDGIPGSSAGGEFPKFTAVRLRADGSSQHVLVKFTGTDGSVATQRWSDLLVCEYLAGRTLSSHLRVPAAASSVHLHGGRTFLEVERFDRHGELGRSALVSWFSLNAAFVGSAGLPWHEAAKPLVQGGWLSMHDLTLIERLWHFGRLIANDDMHDGNLSFRPVQRDGAACFGLAPAYDMLPMVYAPARDGTLPTRRYVPARPTSADATAWEAAAGAALAFWQAAAADPRISAAFRATCADNRRLLAALL